MSFFIKVDEVWYKYDKIWDMIKEKLDIKFHSEPVYETIKFSKVREFDGVIKQTFLVMICQKNICIIIALLA